MDYGNQHDIAIVTLGQDGKCTLIGATKFKVQRRFRSGDLRMGVFSKALGRFVFNSSKAVQKFSPEFSALEELRPRQLRPRQLHSRQLRSRQLRSRQLRPRLLLPRLLRPRIQEQQALANAQITASMSLVADSFKTRVEIQFDLEEDQKEHNGIHMEGLDLEGLD